MDKKIKNYVDYEIRLLIKQIIYRNYKNVFSEI